MWILIAGAGGSGKSIVARYLMENGYEDLTTKTSNEVGNRFENETVLLSSRLKDQLAAASVMSRKDVFTISSLWESEQVYIPISTEMEWISGFESKILGIFCSAFSDPFTLVPPSVVVWTNMPFQLARDRLTLNAKLFDQDFLRAEVTAYEKLMEKIKVPMIELDMSQEPPRVIKQLEFGLASIKSAGLDVKSLWQRSFFR